MCLKNYVDQNWSNLPMQFSINYGLNYLPILVASFVGEQATKMICFGPILVEMCYSLLCYLD